MMTPSPAAVQKWNTMIDDRVREIRRWAMLPECPQRREKWRHLPAGAAVAKASRRADSLVQLFPPRPARHRGNLPGSRKTGLWCAVCRSASRPRACFLADDEKARAGLFEICCRRKSFASLRSPLPITPPLGFVRCWVGRDDVVRNSNGDLANPFFSVRSRNAGQPARAHIFFPPTDSRG